MTKSSTFRVCTLIAALMIGCISLNAAEMATGTISGMKSGSVYNYDITVTDTGTTTIGTFWFSWLPGEGFMSAAPSNVTGPTGWATAITNGNLPSDGFSVRWVAGPGLALNPGDTMSGFDFTSTLSPADLGELSTIHSGTPILTSFVYSGGPFSDAGASVLVTEAPTTTPEPGTTSLVGIALGSMAFLKRRTRLS